MAVPKTLIKTKQGSTARHVHSPGRMRRGFLKKTPPTYCNLSWTYQKHICFSLTWLVTIVLMKYIKLMHFSLESFSYYRGVARNIMNIVTFIVCHSFTWMKEQPVSPRLDSIISWSDATRGNSIRSDADTSSLITTLIRTRRPTHWVDEEIITTFWPLRHSPMNCY